MVGFCIHDYTLERPFSTGRLDGLFVYVPGIHVLLETRLKAKELPVILVFKLYKLRPSKGNR